jgi:formiminoglutamase
MDPFEFTTRPQEELLFRRNDKLDPRLGEAVRVESKHYQAASVVIIGCPQDEGIRRNGGRPGAEYGPAEIRRALYRLTVLGIATERVFDIGDLKLGSSLEQTHELQQATVTQLLRDKKKVIVLGGGNDLSFPDCSALLDLFPDAIAINIDAHFDVRQAHETNSGTPYRQLLEGRRLQPFNFFELGYQPALNSQTYLDYLNNLGVTCMSLRELREDGVLRTIVELLGHDHINSPAIFWGFDLDSVRASDAPGVSAPSPVGFTAEELCDLAGLAGERANTRIIEFTEVNPELDVDNRTSKLVAFAIHEFLRASASSDHS